MADFAFFLLGHEPLGRRANVRKELARIKKDPLQPLLAALGHDGIHVFTDDLTRYVQAYWFYYLSMDRYLCEMSVAARYSRGPAWVRRSGGKQKYTEAERKLADEYNATARFLEYDLVNCLIHTRILLDRTISISRRFLSFARLPSFTSFNDHKKFFLRLAEAFGQHEDYAEYIRTKTDWFEMPIKAVRDKFVVHASPKHMRFMGCPNGGYELDLNIHVPDAPDGEKPFSKIKVIRLNAVRMSYDIETFLLWFNAYGLAALKNGK
ncbi:MAG: hypothetical protein ACYTG0_00775 [Planctomycetota bacterium]|jgi:hypothetical protein